MLEQLRAEHVNMSKLLDALERQMTRFAAREPVDYEIVDGVAEYCDGYPTLCHHPKEDIVFRTLRARSPAAVDGLFLRDEHDKLVVLSNRLSGLVKRVLRDEEVPREWFTRVAASFIDFSRRHMEMEEQQFFPTAKMVLTDKDWEAIEAGVVYPTDPLFGDTAEDRFSALREDILAYDRSYCGAGR